MAAPAFGAWGSPAGGAVPAKLHAAGAGHSPKAPAAASAAEEGADLFSDFSPFAGVSPTAASGSHQGH